MEQFRESPCGVGTNYLSRILEINPTFTTCEIMDFIKRSLCANLQLFFIYISSYIFPPGGFIITAKQDDVVCKNPILGMEHFYFGFELEEGG